MNKNDITAILVTSILPSHPNTHILDETLSSIRAHLPENEIILQIDGLRDERLNRKKDYDEFKNRVLWKCLHEWKNVLPIIFDEHCHQTTMMKKTIDIVNTSALLYVEGDAPLTPDQPIEWQKCLDMMEYEKAYTIRFHFEASIPTEHNHLMFGIDNGFMKTNQWSQRPHLSLTKYYRETVLPFSDEKTFIEDRFHGKVQDDLWNKHRLWIYHPEGNIKRSYHLDGREGTRKFTVDDEVWGYKE
jgi:glycosyltransferase involved in cell wall biosynthesis